MNKIIKYKYWWVGLVVLFVGLIYISDNLHFRIDLTSEKRFSISSSTRQLLDNIDSTITIKVFLNGDLPSDYKKLSNATQDLLKEFRDISHNEIRFELVVPGQNLPDTTKAALYDSLQRQGLIIHTQDVSEGNNKTQDQLIFPYAVVYYKNQRSFTVDLRSSRQVINLVDNTPQGNQLATLNSAEALLEFKFANAIDKLVRTHVPTIVYALGNGEPLNPTVNDLVENVRNDYRMAVFNLKMAYPDPKLIDALIIVKPTQPFSDEDKLKIDQYIMHGGKVIWFVDKLYAELDSLMRSQADFIAFDRNLNLDDILFRYGVRINGDLVQDINCSKIPIVVGQNPDGSPIIQRYSWPYYPFVYSPGDNPISKNLDRVLTIFPSSIDTVKTIGVHKTILLASDTNSRIISSPSLIALNSVKDVDNPQLFTRSAIPIAVLLEGKFTSLFANRLTQTIKDSVLRASGQPFASSAQKETKQIVASDADIVTNQVSSTTGPMPMGELPLENYRFANREFFLNCVDYMVGTSGIFALRNKDFTLRLLDKKKVEDQKTTWQLINIVLPVIIIILFGLMYQWNRKRKFAA